MTPPAGSDRADGRADDTSPGWMRTLSRIGFGAKGVVFVIVGALAIAGVSGASKRQALSEILARPFGRVLLALVAVGLVCYAAWQLIGGVVDPRDREDGDAGGIGKRIGRVASGLAYAALAVAAARLVIDVPGSPAANGATDGAGAEAWTGRLLQMELGRWLVGAVAIGVLVGAGFQLMQAWSAGFTAQFRRGEMSSAQLRWATRAGRVGHAARGIVYVLIAGFLVTAALDDDASRAGGLAKALDAIASRAHGRWLLGAAGVGLGCYGLYCFTVAKYRRVDA